MSGYSKETLIDAYLHRFRVGGISQDDIAILERNALDFYETVDKDTFREHASLDAEAMKDYRINRKESNHGSTQG